MFEMSMLLSLALVLLAPHLIADCTACHSLEDVLVVPEILSEFEDSKEQ
jgi:hypothetical protein